MKQFFTYLLILISLSSLSQTSLSLAGSVVDELNNGPLELAAVVLKTTDSVYVADVFTNASGKFIFPKVSVGKFFLEISYLGYDKYFTSLIEINSSKELEIIKLKKNTTLKEVDIVKIKNAIEFKAGKTVYTVGRDQTNIGLNGLEVLKKIPGVFVDNNDNISVRGKSGVRVYIDDRPSSLSAESPAEAIKFFPAGSIESIEVITNPGAKYDAAGSGAIINIKLKKEKKLGFNGNFNLGSGSKYEFGGVNKYNAGLNANIRRNKTNVFINSNMRIDERRSYMENNREDGTGKYINSTAIGENQSISGFGKAGVDYFINDRNTMGISYLYSSSANNNSNNSTSLNNYNDTFVPVTSARSLTNAGFQAHTFNLNYIYKTKRPGEEYSIDITHNILDRDNIDSISTGYESVPVFKQNQYSNTLGVVLSNTAQLDYSRALKGDGKIEAGIKNSYIGNKSDFKFFNSYSNTWFFDSARSNKFDYFENVAGGYIQYTNKYKKWDYEIGLRGEYTKVNSNLTSVKQQYFNLFPDIQFSKKFEENRQLSFSYSSRIDRVPFMMLSNAVTYTDKYAGQRGNPNLKPERSNGFSLDLEKQFDGSKDLKMGGAGISFFGSIDKNAVGYLVVIDTNNVGFVTYANIAKTWSYGTSMYVQMSYKKWYNAAYSVSGVYNYFNEASKGAIYNIYSQHNFKFLKHHSANINGYYFSKFFTAQGYVKGTYQINVGYRYIFWKEKGSISLNVSDIFKTGKYFYYVNSPGYKLTGVFQSETRFAYLTFQYKFSKGWQGDGKKRTKKNNKDSRLDFNNSGGGGLGK